MEDGPFTSATNQLQVTELSTEGAVLLIVAGDLDIATAPALCDRMARWRGGRVVLDLSASSFCDVAAMRAIAVESRAVRERGGRFAVVAPPGSPARRLLEVARLTEVVDVHDERARAISRVRPTR